MSPESLDSRFYPTPPLFSNVAARDYWLWHHMNVALLNEADLDRLLKLPSSEPPVAPSGAAARVYAVGVAKDLQADGRWIEASAYWLAAAKAAIESRQDGLIDHLEAIEGFLRALCVDAGLRSEVSSLEALVDIAVSSPSAPLREALLRGLVVLGSGCDTDGLLNAVTGNSRVRGAVGAALVDNFSSLSGRLHKVKGSHDVFRTIVHEYSVSVRLADEVASTVIREPTLNALRDAKAKTIKAIGILGETALYHDRYLLSDAQRILRDSLTSYLAHRDEPRDDIYLDFVGRTEELLSRTRTVGTELSTCYLAPLVLAWRQAVSTHYDGVTIAQRAAPIVRLLKQIVSPSAAAFRLEIGISNDGTAAAEACDLRLTAMHSGAIHFGADRSDDESVFIGRLKPGATEQRGLLAFWDTNEDAVEVRGALSYRDRVGSYSKAYVFKVAKQREIDWPALRARASPYQIPSLTEPGRLKGRDALLQTLFQGFRSSRAITRRCVNDRGDYPSHSLPKKQTSG